MTTTFTKHPTYADWTCDQHPTLRVTSHGRGFAVYHGAFCVATRPTVLGARRIAANIAKELAAEAAQEPS